MIPLTARRHSAPSLSSLPLSQRRSAQLRLEQGRRLLATERRAHSPVVAVAHGREVPPERRGEAQRRRHGDASAARDEAGDGQRSPVVSRYAVRTARPRLIRVRRTYSAWRFKASCPAPLVRIARRRLMRVSRTYSTEAPGRTCKLRRSPVWRGGGRRFCWRCCWSFCWGFCWGFCWSLWR